MRMNAPSKRLTDAYRFPGFTPRQTITGIFGDPHARIVTLIRRSKKRSAEHAEPPPSPHTITSAVASVTFLPAMLVSISTSKFVESIVDLAVL